MVSSSLSALALVLLSSRSNLAHGVPPQGGQGGQSGHDSAPAPADPNDWASVHMSSEHHIAGFDATSFFALHDYDADGTWEPAEIRRTYGMGPGSTDGVGGPGCSGDPSEDRRREVERAVLSDFDADRDGVITRQEFVDAWYAGRRLRDFGHGPGHHGDDEYEYELHHFERFHDENTTEEDLIHPEDIAHFAKHDQMDAEADRQAVLDQMSIVEQNIPAMFRRVS